MKKLKLNIQMFASTNKTANYDLPQFVGTDKPTWLGDINEAMADIDAGMHENATNISNMASDVASASATASQASQDVAGLTSTVNTLSSNVTAVTTTANNAQSTATSALNTANTANGKADTNANDISTINSTLTTTNTKVANITGSILWSNPNASVSFSDQNVTLSSDDYDMIEIIFTQGTSRTKNYSMRLLKGEGTQLTNIVGLNDGVSQPIGARQREVTYVNDTTLHFGKGLVHDNSTQQVTPDVRNDVVIPLYIIGYKLGIFS